MRKRGFTLVEVMLVVALTGVLLIQSFKIINKSFNLNSNTVAEYNGRYNVVTTLRNMSEGIASSTSVDIDNNTNELKLTIHAPANSIDVNGSDELVYTFDKNTTFLSENGIPLFKASKVEIIHTGSTYKITIVSAESSDKGEYSIVAYRR